MDIEAAQVTFRSAYGEGFFGDEDGKHKCHSNGEVEGWLFNVYRLRDSHWAFKSAIPVTAASAAAVSAYLAALDKLAPNHITDMGGDTMGSNAQGALDERSEQTQP